MSALLLFSLLKPSNFVQKFPVSILRKSISGRHRPVRVADGPMTARYRFTQNASWVITTCLLCLCMNFIPSVNLSSYLRRAPRHRRNTLDFEGKCLSAESCMDKVVKLKFFLVLIKHLRGR